MLARMTVRSFLPKPYANPSRGAKLFVSVLKCCENGKGESLLASGIL